MPPDSPKKPNALNAIIFFDALSTMSWQMCITSPLVLFVRSLGASGLALGLLTGLNPIMSVLQLPLAPHVARRGYKRTMMFGWGVRTVVLTPLIALPVLADSIGRQSTVVIVLVIMALFTALRASGVVAWLPWMSALLPAASRGAFLSRDRFFMNIAALAGLTLSGIFLARGTIGSYSLGFGVGIVAAYVSLVYLWRIPEPAQIPAAPTASSGLSSIRATLRNPAFRKLLTFGALAQIINLGAGAFTLVYARTRIGLPDSALLWLTAGASILVMAGTTWVRNRLDRHGSKPFLWATLGWWTIAIGSWLLMTLNGTPAIARFIAPVLLVVTDGFAWMFELFTMRLTLNTLADAPDNATHFAVYSVVVNVIAGLAPIAFGTLLDSLAPLHVPLGAMMVDNYGVLFALELGVIALAALALRRVINA